MPHISKENQDSLTTRFAAMTGDVTLAVFTQEFECQFCTHTRELAGELADLSDKIHLEIHDFVKDGEAVKRLGIDKIPALAIIGARDHGIRYFGVPGGYEFSSLVETIVEVSTGAPPLKESTITALAAIDTPVHIQVFVSLTCPFCPRAVHMAHSFALASNTIRADMVEIAEFPHIAQKHEVLSVPKIVVNDTFSFEGALSESAFLKKIQEALKH